GRPEGWFHPSVSGGGAGGTPSPSAAPLSTQPTMMAISRSVSEGLLLNRPNRGSAYHGGISRDATFLRIDCAHGRASANVSSDIGVACRGRWQPAHFARTIGATSRLNVGGSAGAWF